MPISRTEPLPALLWVFLCFVTPARAATLNVPTATYPTIQAAVNAAANGDTVLVADGTYSGPGNRDIDFGGKNLTVRSASGNPTRTIVDCGGTNTTDGSGDHRGFYIHSGETSVTISGLTIKNGYENSVSTVTDSGIGGGIFNGNIGGTIAIINCVVSGNYANDGGGIYNHNDDSNGVGGTITLTACTVAGNSASDGGGGGVLNTNDGKGGTITLTNCSLSGNVGGGITNYNATPNGSASNGGTITLTSCSVSGNSSEYYSGGGVANINANSNSGPGGTITLTNCTVSGNSVENGNGGGLYNHNDDISGNGGTITVADCTVVGNTALDGGGVQNANYANNNDSYHATITLTNCTVSENVARLGGGGGVSNYDDFDGNRRTVTLINCILYGDKQYTGGEIENATGFLYATYSDIQGGYPGTGNINADPLFVYAAGGNLHLRPGSPCLGAGTSSGAPATDKDGVVRPNPPSIGAYEATPSHTHLLWNNSDGRVMLWSVAADGSFTLNGFGPYTDNAPQNVWHATAVATGPDGVSHLLWNNTDGRVMLWTVDDAGNFTLAGYGPYTDNAPQNKWSATAVSVGPDNTVHLLWSNTDHRAMLWNIAADFTFTLAGYGPYTDTSVNSNPGNLWTATALATGPDGVSRIVWNNTDYRVMLWNVAPDFSFTLAGYGPYTDNAPQNKWSAAGVSVGPDNVQHILWSNTDRRAMFWNVDSAFGFTLAGYGPYTDNAPGNLWSATALATGPDGLSHILWGNTDYRAMLWGVDNSFNFGLTGYGPYTDDAPGNLWSATAVSAGP